MADSSAGWPNLGVPADSVARRGDPTCRFVWSVISHSAAFPIFCCDKGASGARNIREFGKESTKIRRRRATDSPILAIRQVP